MSSIFRSRFIRGFNVCMFTGVALLVGFYGVSLIVEAFDRHGSSGGNAILFALGLILLVLAPVAFIFGVVYWTRSRPSPKENNS